MSQPGGCGPVAGVTEEAVHGVGDVLGPEAVALEGDPGPVVGHGPGVPTVVRAEGDHDHRHPPGEGTEDGPRPAVDDRRGAAPEDRVLGEEPLDPQPGAGSCRQAGRRLGVAAGDDRRDTRPGCTERGLGQHLGNAWANTVPKVT